MKRLIATILVFLFLIISISMVAGAIKIWPGKLTITLDEGYGGEEIKHPIQVTNTHSYNISVSAKIENPSDEKFSDNYSYMPNLNWVKTIPEVLYLPAKTSGKFEVYVEIPESERSSYYHQSWETWVVLTESSIPESKDSINIQLELAVKLFINTPPSKELTTIENLFIIIGIFISIIIIVITVHYITNKKGSSHN